MPLCYHHTPTKIPIASTMLAIAVVNIINGKPIFRERLNVIVYPCFSASPTAIMPALDPISVPFHPKPDPKAKAHHMGFIAKPPNAAEIDSFWLSVETKGIIVAAKGMLSTKAVRAGRYVFTCVKLRNA
jgi:hypothetical protein